MIVCHITPLLIASMNPFGARAKRWYYEGRKLTELLYWNALLWDLNKDEQRELFKVNGFELDNLL